MALKKSLTIKVSAEMKKEIEKYAKASGMRASELAFEWINAGLIQSRPTKDISDKVLDTIKGNGIFKQEGLLELEMKPHKNALIYSPDAWCISEEQLGKILKVPKSIIHMVAADLTEYNLIDPDSKSKYASSLLKHFIKTLNIYSLGGAANYDAAVRKVFRQEIPQAVILSKKINPVSLAKVCSDNSGKKIVYVLDLKEFDENARENPKQV